jgi:hypothetical protein
MKGSHANRKASKDEMAYATQVIQEAFPDYDVVWGSHGDYGGGRVPRDHTLSFRLRDRWGKYHSNVIWVMPDCLASITAGWVKRMVKQGTSRKTKSKKT